MKYIFSIGLIPVQEFIGESGRSRDLRTGSALLSWLMARILHLLKTKVNANILVPQESHCLKIASKTLSDLLNEPQYSIPNRASGYCHSNNLESLRKEFNLLKNFITEEWKKWVDEYFCAEKFFEPYKNKIQMELWDYFDTIPDKDMLATPFHLIWVAFNSNNSDSNSEKTKEDLSKINNYYDSVKITRPIRSWTLAAPIGKCTQCGKREAIGPNKNFHEWRKRYKEVSETPPIKAEYRFDSKERLCYVCVVKRLLAYSSKKSERFPSTNEIALRNWMDKLQESSEWKNFFEEKLKELKSLLKDDWPLIFWKKDKSRLFSKLKLDNESYEQNKKEIIEFQEKLKIFCQKIDHPNEPPDYLALLVYDGDSMGKHVQNYPNKIPAQMTEFSIEVKNLCKEFSAEPFYLGGDEGIVLSPVESSLELPLSVESSFKAAFIRIDTSMTISCGMTLFERRRPLGAAVKLAFSLLKEAKELEEKNAFGIGVQTASGNQWQFLTHWGKPWNRIKNLIEKIRANDLSRSWAYEVEDFCRSLSDDSISQFGMDKAIISEIKRITWRKFSLEPKSEDKREAFQVFWKELEADDWIDEYYEYPDLITWANQFHLIGYLSRFGNLESSQ